MLTGVYKPTAGSIVFDGHDVTGKPPHRITELGVGRTFQNIRLFEQMTSLENVLVGMHSRLSSRLVILRSILRTPGLRREEREARERGAGAASVLAGFAAATTSSRATCRTATSGASRWLARSPPTRSSCSSTSPRPA